MRVKIGKTWHDSSFEPICIQINEGEQKQISEMDRSVATQGKYAVFPDIHLTTAEEKLKWMMS